MAKANRLTNLDSEPKLDAATLERLAKALEVLRDIEN